MIFFNMKIHREGFIIILITLLLSTGLILFVHHVCQYQWQFFAVATVSLGIISMLLWFFRNPNRFMSVLDCNVVIAPADGKIVAIEEVEENEYFNDKRILVSIFMSPLDVHVNRYPVSGNVSYVKYHPGEHMVAWHPKSSLLNERSTVVIKTYDKHEILVRQIAGAVARRIVTYPKVGDEVLQGADLGFIKFGSRVDLFLPVDVKIKVKVDQISIGNQTEIATFY